MLIKTLQQENNSDSEKIFLEMLKNTPVAICFLRGENMVVEKINDEVCRIWGLKEDEIIGRELFDLRPEAKKLGFHAILLNVLNTGVPFSGLGMKSSLERFGNVEEIYCNYYASPYRNEVGEIVGLITYANDVTKEFISNKNLEENIKERQAANIHMQNLNQEFKFVMDFLPQMLWATLPNGYSFYYNQGWIDYTGLSHDNNIGFGWTQALHPDDYDKTVQAWKQAVSNGILYEIEYRIRRYDGVYRWFLGRGLPMRNSEGEIVKWYGSSTDINEQKQALQDKDEFLGTVSHELKTPVTSLKGFCEYQYSKFKDKGDDESAEILKKMNTQINKLTDLISDLLDVNRVEAGKFKFNPEHFRFSEVIVEVIEELQQSTSRHQLIYNGHSELEIYADKVRIGQVLNNLLSNAIKYSPNSENIEIRMETENDQVICSVIDNGIGIKHDRQAHVFDRFFKVSGNKMDSYPGLGLGLYISSEIIQRHGGKIWMESTEGKGSVFSFSLPILYQSEMTE